ncbi:PEP-CTERM sorting domain-containing protein [Tolypothrix sp. FACHB-123]|uniref:PEP-CTERM sorting domain-containing protein n=1 Tax=Tolypothrix sp. FACHB-123 TaxID=2692868 RepID=UPI0016832ACD|nr:PEP-CTERM sorting domain-containing protein [Tolypothrix sp. FACHB-123]MBD2353866.1 PEP-CTERM sorting domain-containing protein [Tolypothrix sp. FACHB-123]
MKLTKHVSVAAASLALTVAAVNAKPAQAASVVLDNQVGQEYKYKVNFDNSNTSGNQETLIPGSSWTLSGLKGVTDVFADVNYLLAEIFGQETVRLTLKKSVSGTEGTSNPSLNFSILSPFKPNNVNWSLTRVNPNGKQNLFSDEVIGPVEDVPEPVTVGGSLLAVGFAAWMKRKKAELAQEA